MDFLETPLLQTIGVVYKWTQWSRWKGKFLFIPYLDRDKYSPQAMPVSRC